MLLEHDPFKEHREAVDRFCEKDIRIAPRKGEAILVTFCDGKKHRTLSGGAWDRLEKIEPCNHECEDWKPAKGREVLDAIPNLSPKWVEE